MYVLHFKVKYLVVLSSKKNFIHKFCIKKYCVLISLTILLLYLQEEADELNLRNCGKFIFRIKFDAAVYFDEFLVDLAS